MRWTEVPAAAWRTPQELVQEGFGRGRVVMLNEAHDELTRCVRARRVGRRTKRPRDGRPAPGHGGAAARRRPGRQHNPPAARCRRWLPGPTRHARTHPGRLGAWLDAVALP